MLQLLWETSSPSDVKRMITPGWCRRDLLYISMKMTGRAHLSIKHLPRFLQPQSPRRRQPLEVDLVRCGCRQAGRQGDASQQDRRL